MLIYENIEVTGTALVEHDLKLTELFPPFGVRSWGLQFKMDTSSTPVGVVFLKASVDGEMYEEYPNTRSSIASMVDWTVANHKIWSIEHMESIYPLFKVCFQLTSGTLLVKEIRITRI